MFKGLDNCEIKAKTRYYRTEANRPNLEQLAYNVRTSSCLDETIANARRLLNALHVDDIIKEHEEIISQCMAYIKADTEQGTIITKEFMASYLHYTHHVSGQRHKYTDNPTDPRGATEIALERLTDEGYLRRVKVRHKTNAWDYTYLDAYQVI